MKENALKPRTVATGLGWTLYWDTSYRRYRMEGSATEACEISSYVLEDRGAWPFIVREVVRRLGPRFVPALDAMKADAVELGLMKRVK